ncbi:MAG: phosphate signaling complex protein PhoU [Deltaproteobacteria bacterium]|nr:phosphate signaling complex protein PhoU [Deltaproteobacteria bacterium]
MTHFEETLQRDIQRIRDKVTEMAALAAIALRRCLQALAEKNRQLAYAVIIRDQQIDELDREIDRLCLEFIVRQQPVAGTLRFAYSTIKINRDIERVGDYAESIARHILTLTTTEVAVPNERYSEISDRAISMFNDAIQAFIKQDEELAKRTMETEPEVDRLRHRLNRDLVQMQREQLIPVEALLPLMSVANRYERVADQAKNICQEVLYVRTGEYVRHHGSESVRILFVDDDHSCLSQMAEVIGNSLGRERLIFTSAGIDRKPVDPAMVTFLKAKGVDLSGVSSRTIAHVPHIHRYQVIIGLSKAACRVFPPPPTKVVCIEWQVDDPSKVQGSPEEIHSAYERVYDYLGSHIHDLANAIIND